jgi:hypothetical protein
MTFSDLQTLLAKRIALIKRVHKTSKRAVWYVRFYNKNNRRYAYKSLNTDDKKKAEKLAIEVYEKASRGEVKLPNSSNAFNTIANDYINEFTKSQLTALVKKYRAQLINNYPVAFFGNKDISDITAKDLDNFIIWCNKKNGKQLASDSLNKITGATKSVFEYAVRHNLIEKYPQFTKVKTATPEARSFFEVSELILMARRAKIDYELIVNEQAKIKKVYIDNTKRNSAHYVCEIGNKQYKNYDLYKVKNKTLRIVIENGKAELKLQYVDKKYDSAVYGADDLFQLRAFITFMSNTYLRTSEWSGIKVKHCVIKKLTADEIGRMRVEARKQLEKRKDSLAKFEKLELYVVNSKNKKSSDKVRVFYRGAVDSTRRLIAHYKLKADDYLFYNNFKTRKYAEQRVSKMFENFLQFYKMKESKTNQLRSLYSLRHSGIVMSLLNGVDVLLLSKNADTGVKMIQMYYGSRITNRMSGVLLV